MGFILSNKLPTLKQQRLTKITKECQKHVKLGTIQKALTYSTIPAEERTPEQQYIIDQMCKLEIKYNNAYNDLFGDINE